MIKNIIGVVIDHAPTFIKSIKNKKLPNSVKLIVFLVTISGIGIDMDILIDAIYLIHLKDNGDILLLIIGLLIILSLPITVDIIKNIKNSLREIWGLIGCLLYPIRYLINKISGGKK